MSRITTEICKIPNPSHAALRTFRFFVEVVPTKPALEAEQREKDKIEQDRRITNFTGDLAFYTKLLFGATAALALATFGLALVSYSQMREARKAIVAAEASAKASEQHAKTAERALTELERAYVIAGVIGTGSGLHEGTNYIVLRASASNYGKTPGFIDHIHWHVGPYGPNTTRDGYQNHIFVGWVIGPDTRRGEELQTNEIGMLQLPLSEPLIFHGLVTYTDIFGKAHYCGFAYRINQNGSWQPISRVDAYVRRD